MEILTNLLKRSFRFRWLGALAMGLPIALGCPNEPPRPSVQVAPQAQGLSTTAYEVRLGRLSADQSLVGTVRPARATPIVAEAAGKVVLARAEDGEFKKAGQLLFKLDDSRQQLALEQAKAQIAVLSVDEAWLEAELVRKTTLADKGSITTYARDAARYQRDKIRAAKAQAEIAQKNAERALLDTRVSAPHAGELTQVAVRQGEVVAPGRPLALLVDRSTVRVRVGVSAADAARRQVGEVAQLQFPGVAHDALTGMVRFIAPLASSGSGLIDVDVELVSPPPAVRAGMSASVRFASQGAAGADGEARANENVALIPRAAVLNDDEGTYVFVIENKTAQRRDIQTGASTTKLVEVSTGLEAGEWIALSGLYALGDNDAVVVSERQRAPKAKSATVPSN